MSPDLLKEIKGDLQKALENPNEPYWPVHYKALLGFWEADWANTKHSEDADAVLAVHPWLDSQDNDNGNVVIWASREDWIAQAARMVGEELVCQWLLEWEEA